jgi:hypothetical protein
MTKVMKHIWFARLAFVAAIALGGLAATGAFASHVRTRHTGFSVFAHHLIRAHRADAGSASAPQGAVLANVVTTNGVTNELYAWHRTPQEVCLVDVEASLTSVTVCSPTASAESNGVSFAGKTENSSATNVAALVPNGVKTVRVTDSNGAILSVAVVNNVMDYASSNVTAFSFVMPSGAVVSHSAAPAAAPAN